MSLTALLNGIGYLLGKIPIQGRKERWKNELDKLKKEREDLLNGKWDNKKGKRLSAINLRVNDLERLLFNSSDAN